MSGTKTKTPKEVLGQLKAGLLARCSVFAPGALSTIPIASQTEDAAAAEASERALRSSAQSLVKMAAAFTIGFREPNPEGYSELADALDGAVASVTSGAAAAMTLACTPLRTLIGKIVSDLLQAVVDLVAWFEKPKGRVPPLLGVVEGACRNIMELRLDNRAMAYQAMITHACTIREAVDELERDTAGDEEDEDDGEGGDDEDEDDTVLDFESDELSEDDKKTVAPFVTFAKYAVKILEMSSSAITSGGGAIPIQKLEECIRLAGDATARVDDAICSIEPPQDRADVIHNSERLRDAVVRLAAVATEHLPDEGDATGLRRTLSLFAAKTTEACNAIKAIQ